MLFNIIEGGLLFFSLGCFIHYIHSIDKELARGREEIKHFGKDK